MIFQVGHFAKAPVANVAAVRPGSVVNVHVRLQIAGSWEGFLAQLTFMGFLLRKK